MEATLSLVALLLYSVATVVATTVTPDNCKSGVDVYNRAFHLSSDMEKLPAMKYAMDTAINRAIFYSLIYKWSAYDIYYGHPPNPEDMEEYRRQPGINYIYMSTTATVHAAPAGVLTSGLLFDRNSSYPNWLPDVYFNMTLPLFGVRADRNLIKDLGSTPESNYTDPAVYPQNEFYQDLRTSNSPAPREGYVFRYYDLNDPYGYEEVSFYLNKVDGVVGKFTDVFYDCGQENQWMLSAVSMATELLGRSTMWHASRHNRSVAASTVGVQLEFLQQSHATASLTSARLAAAEAQLARQDSNRCKNLAAADESVPLSSDYWSEADIASTLEAEGREGLRLAHFLSNFFQNNDYNDNERHNEHMQDVYNQWDYRNPNPPVFTDPMIEVKEDQPLTRRQLASEVYAMLMSTDSLLGVGIFLDEGVFPDSSVPVSAFAWREEGGWWYRGMQIGGVVDVYTEGHDYTQEAWFLQVKQEYGQVDHTNSMSFTNGRTVRSSRFGSARPTPEPVTYLASSYEQGTWLPPHFLCGPRQAGWAASYMSPILVKDGSQGLRFGGVVKLDVAFTAKSVSP